MQTYLDLCNTMIVELGINGGQKLATTAPGGTSSLESERVCAMIADADFEIQNLHHNWRFLWRQFNAQLPAGMDMLPTPMYRQLTSPVSGQYGAQNLFQFRKMDRESLVFNYDNPTLSNRPKFQPWRQFETLWQSRGPKSVSNSPPFFSQTPQGNILVSTVMQTQTLFRYECWARPMRLLADGDISPLVRAVMVNDTFQNIVPPMLLQNPSSNLSINQLRVGTGAATAPLRNESCRIIIVRAKIIWAEVEGATEVMQAALAEYQDLLEELRADQLPGMEHDRVSESDVEMTVETI
jgi:hypothetical protein